MVNIVLWEIVDQVVVNLGVKSKKTLRLLSMFLIVVFFSQHCRDVTLLEIVGDFTTTA
jgi:hypothetical protein